MPKFSVKKPLTVFVAVLAIVVLGVVAYLKMTPDLMPNMDFPYVILVTTDPGASPETVEADITKPLEQSMATLDRIKNVTSSSMDSVSMVVLEFEDGVNMDTVSVDIQQKINQLKGSWGDTVGDPYVLKMNPSMLPVQVAALSYDGKDITQLSDFVNDTLSPKLEGITGVASVTVSGTVERQLHVILSQKKLDALSQRLSDAIAKQLDDAAGQLASARGQVNSAKAAIRSAEESAVRDAVTQALTTIQDSLKTMRDSRDQLQDNLRELADIQREKARLEAENAPYQAKIEAIRQNPSMTEEEKQAAIAEIESDPEYVRRSRGTRIRCRILIRLRLALSSPIIIQESPCFRKPRSSAIFIRQFGSLGFWSRSNKPTGLRSIFRRRKKKRLKNWRFHCLKPTVTSRVGMRKATNLPTAIREGLPGFPEIHGMRFSRQHTHKARRFGPIPISTQGAAVESGFTCQDRC